MAEAKFSWLKAASFLGALALVIVCVVMLGLGFNLISAEQTFQGCICIIAGALSGVFAFFVYKNYQKKSLEDR